MSNDLQAAIALHQKGRVSDARVAYARVLQQAPHNPVALHLLGVTFLQEGKAAEALPWLRRAAAFRPQDADMLGGLAAALGATDCFAEAADVYQRLLVIRPEEAYAWRGLAEALQKLGRLKEAVRAYKRILVLAQDAGVLTNFGALLKDLGRLGEAVAAHRRALELEPGLAAAHNNLGAALEAQEKLEEALASYLASFAADPRYVRGRVNAGAILQKLNRHEDAVALYQEALSFQPDDAGALYNWSNALLEMNRVEEMFAVHERLFSFHPGHEEALWIQAGVFLARGELRRGWESYERRWSGRRPISPPPPAGCPLWLGEGEPGPGPLLLQAEQGLGDTIHMLRYVPLLEARGTACWLQVPETLRALAARSFPAARVFSDVAVPPGAARRIPMMSLPLALRTDTVADIPGRVPYLTPDGARAAHWRAALPSGKGRRVGLAWRGSPTHERDRWRSARLEDFLPFLEREDFLPVIFQKGLTEAERALLARYPRAAVADAADLDDLAALLSVLDHVVAVDSSPAHLAGALARPASVLLPFYADWRWLLDRADSPWYPTARLFRQPARGAWAPAVAAALKELAA
ncbi:MAG: tetratricopeptide repeat protein [Verrucomicrobium sp.]|nr:tetratricopeptide repeat protein [Verrucomicrobium sp.]